jgi:hypothetical protein
MDEGEDGVCLDSTSAFFNVETWIFPQHAGLGICIRGEQHTDRMPQDVNN